MAQIVVSVVDTESTGPCLSLKIGWGHCVLFLGKTPRKDPKIRTKQPDKMLRGLPVIRIMSSETSYTLRCFMLQNPMTDVPIMFSSFNPLNEALTFINFFWRTLGSFCRETNEDSLTEKAVSSKILYSLDKRTV